MALPYPTKVVLPFDIATAQDMNERHANDVALANGTGLDDEAITERTLAQNAKRQFKVGDIATASGTADITVTGVGFRPKAVQFIWMDGTSTAGSRGGSGFDDGVNRRSTAHASAGSNFARVESSTYSMVALQTSGTILFEGRVKSFTADGFTIEVNTGATPTTKFGYMAMA